MKQLLMLLLLIALMLLSTSVAAAGSPKDILAEAENLHKQAVTLQGGWGDTVKLVKKARKLVTAGKDQAARDLAVKARDMARRSLQQAKAVKTDWSEPDYLQSGK